MARVESQVSVVECQCGLLHEACYVSNKGGMGGGYDYLCRGEQRPVLPDQKTRVVTLGLTVLPRAGGVKSDG